MTNEPMTDEREIFTRVRLRFNPSVELRNLTLRDVMVADPNEEPHRIPSA